MDVNGVFQDVSGEHRHHVCIGPHDLLAALAGFVDRWIIGGLCVRGTSGVTQLFGFALRLVQTGNLQTYAFLFVLGVVGVLYFALK